MVHENEHGEHDQSPEVPATRPRRHRAARRPAGPPVVHHEEQDLNAATAPTPGAPSVSNFVEGIDPEDLERFVDTEPYFAVTPPPASALDAATLGDGDASPKSLAEGAEGEPGGSVEWGDAGEPQAEEVTASEAVDAHEGPGSHSPEETDDGQQEIEGEAFGAAQPEGVTEELPEGAPTADAAGHESRELDASSEGGPTGGDAAASDSLEGQPAGNAEAADDQDLAHQDVDVPVVAGFGHEETREGALPAPADEEGQVPAPHETAQTMAADQAPEDVPDQGTESVSDEATPAPDGGLPPEAASATPEPDAEGSEVSESATQEAASDPGAEAAASDPADQRTPAADAHVYEAAQTPTDDDAAAQNESGQDTGDAAQTASAEESAEPPRTRRSRRATRGVVTAAFSSVAETAPAQATRPADRPAPALFQAPDLTASPPAAPTASPSDAVPADEEESAAEGASEGGGAAPGRRSRRATRAAGAPVQVVTDEPVEAASTSEAEGLAQAGDDEDDDQPRRRRRRGGRRRRRSGSGADDVESGSADQDESEGQLDAVTESADAGAAASDQEAEEGTSETAEAAGEDEESGSGRRRRRRRRRAGVSEEMEDLSADDPPNTVTKVREARRASDEVVGVRGSTRIEAKKQRRRDGREAGRRRAPILTEAEFLARRESVNRVMCVRQRGDRTQIAVLEDGILVEHYVNRAESSSMVGNVYLGKVQNVLPSMEAAFVDIGRGRNAVLYAGEVNWDAAGLEGQPKRIELALKSGDAVLVQVTKDPIGHKGARLTSQISLPGRFLVYVPEGSMTGISRKLPDTERARLKGILKDVVPEGAGVIVRTAAEGATEEQLTADVQRLTGEWADIQRKAKSSSPPTLLYGEPDLAIKVVRDIFNEDFTTLLVQGDDTAGTLSDYIGRVAPDLLGRVQQWADPEDLYTAHRIDEQLAKALDRKVWLPSGGSLVIDRTEAMTVVDVNTGKFTGQGGNLEETVTRNNLEAAEEIVRQLRLRDIGGIIVIDFIDMVLESNRDLVLRRLVECLGRDRTKHQVAEVTSLGLVQMTRKRIGQGLLEVFSTPCEACGGRGHIVHTDPVGTGAVEEPSRGRDRGNNRRSQRPAPQVHLGGKQTGKTPPPPKFDEHGHIDHSEEQSAPEGEPEPGAPSEESVDVSSSESGASSPESGAPDAGAGPVVSELVTTTEPAADPAPAGTDQGIEAATDAAAGLDAAELHLDLVEASAGDDQVLDTGSAQVDSPEANQHDGNRDGHESDVSDHADQASASQVVV